MVSFKTILVIGSDLRGWKGDAGVVVSARADKTDKEMEELRVKVHDM